MGGLQARAPARSNGQEQAAASAPVVIVQQGSDASKRGSEAAHPTDPLGPVGNVSDTVPQQQRDRRVPNTCTGTCCDLAGVVSINAFVLKVTVNVLSLDRRIAPKTGEIPSICLEALVQPTTETIVKATPNNPCPLLTQHTEFSSSNGIFGNFGLATGQYYGWRLDDAVYTLDTPGASVIAPVTNTSSDTIQFRVLMDSPIDGVEELGGIDLTGEELFELAADCDSTKQIVVQSRDARVRLLLQAQDLNDWNCGDVPLPIKLGADIGGWELVGGIAEKRTASPSAEQDWTGTVKRASGNDDFDVGVPKLVLGHSLEEKPEGVGASDLELGIFEMFRSAGNPQIGQPIGGCAAANTTDSQCTEILLPDGHLWEPFTLDSLACGAGFQVNILSISWGRRKFSTSGCPEGFAWDDRWNKDDGFARQDGRLRELLQVHCGPGNVCASDEFKPWKVHEDLDLDLFDFLGGHGSLKVKWKCEKSLYDCSLPADGDEIVPCAAANANIFSILFASISGETCAALGCCYNAEENICFQRRVPAIPTCPRIISAEDLSSEVLFDESSGAILTNSLTSVGMEKSFTIMANYDPHTHDSGSRLLFSSRVLSEVEISKVHAGVRDPEFHEDLNNRQIAMYADVTSAGQCSFRMKLGTCVTTTPEMPCPLQNRIAVQFSYNFTTRATRVRAEALDGTTVDVDAECTRIKAAFNDGLVVGSNDVIGPAADVDQTAGLCQGQWEYELTITDVRAATGVWTQASGTNCSGHSDGKCDALVQLCDIEDPGYDDVEPECSDPYASSFLAEIGLGFGRCSKSTECNGVFSGCTGFNPSLSRTFSGDSPLLSNWMVFNVWDNSQDELVSHFCLQDGELDPSKSPQSYHISDGNTNISYTISSECSANYYGATCCVFCPPPTDLPIGTAHHSGCDENGTWICIDDWSGPQCGTAPERTSFVYQAGGGALSNMVFYGVADPEGLLFTSFRLSTRVRSATFGRGVFFDRVFIVAPSETENDDFQGCDDRDALLPFSFWRDQDSEGEFRYHAGWPNDLTPLHEYELRLSWNHYTSSGTDAECWMPFQTTCGCSTSDPFGIPASFRSLETTTDMKFRFVDMSGCEQGYNFYRRRTCRYDHQIQPSATGRTDLNVTFVVDSAADSGTDDEVIVTVADPKGRTCAVVTIDSLADGETVLLELKDLDCIFDGCPPLITLEASGPNIVSFVSALVEDGDGQRLIQVSNWNQRLGLLPPEAQKDDIHTALELPILEALEGLDIEYLRRSVCFETHFTSRSGDDLGVTNDGELVFGVGDVFEYCIEAIGVLQGLGDGYASPQTCTHARIQYLAGIRGAVKTSSTHPVVGVRVVGHLLTNDDVLGDWATFKDRSARRRRAIGDRSRRAAWALNVTCPAEPAFDQIGRALANLSWPETVSGEFASLDCPLFDEVVEPRTVSRQCEPDGRWAYAAGLCDTALREYESAELPPQSALALGDITIGRLSPLSLDLCGWECAYLRDECVAIRYVFETGACLLLNDTLKTVTNLTQDGEDFGFYRLKETARPDFGEGPATQAPTAEVWCTVEEGATTTRFGLPALSIPDAVAGGLAHDAVLGGHFVYASQVAAVETLGCTHVEGNVAVMCPHGRTLEERCDELTVSLYHEFLCKEPSEARLARWRESCVAGDDGFPQNNDLQTFLVRKTLRTGLPASCALPLLAPVTSLYPLRKLVLITGSVVVQDCQELLRLDGAFSRLRVIGGILEQPVSGAPLPKSLVIQRNPSLTGHLPSSLPSLHFSVIPADVSSNPLLCAGEVGVDFPATWTMANNAPANNCGCRISIAENFNVDALFSDGSCLMTYCDGCHSGTHGPCSFEAPGGDRICTEALDLLEVGKTIAGLRCPAGTESCTPDLCHNVICVDPPPCQQLFAGADPAVGTCDDGACLYDNVTVGVSCDDNNPLTGPDQCTGLGGCVGPASCTVAGQTGREDETFGGVIATQADMETMRGCVVVDGNLAIDCDGDAGLTNFSALEFVTEVTGALVIKNCPGVTSFAPGMTRLAEVAGAYRGSGIIIENNAAAEACLSAQFPALEVVASRIKVADNPRLCTSQRLFHDDWHVTNSHNEGCGCTDNGTFILNFDPAATLDDCSCVTSDPCIVNNVTCAQDVPCHIVSCNSSTPLGECNILTPVGIDTECDDSNPTSVLDTCQDRFDPLGATVPGERVCRGQLPATNLPGCQKLNFCTNSSIEDDCHFVADPALDTLACDDGFGFTLGDTCNAVGECIHGALLGCYPGDDGAPVMEMRAEDQASLLTCVTEAASEPVPGDILSWNVHVPDAGAVDSLAIQVYGRDLGTFTDLAEIQGHWKILTLPTREFLDANCLKSCYDKALSRFRANELDDTHHLQYFLDTCGHPERHCNVEGVEVEPKACFDRIDHEVCEFFADLLDCAEPAADVQITRLPEEDAIHVYVVPDVGDATVRFDVAASAAATRPQFGNVDIWHFDRRPLKRYATAVTNENGEFVLEFLAPHPLDEADVSIQRVVMYPFAYVQEGNVSLLHQYQERASAEVQGPDGEPLANPNEVPELFYSWLAVEHRDTAQVSIVDISAFVLQGRVTYGDNPALVDGANCPAVGLTICTHILPDLGVDDTVLGEVQRCTDTDENGEYSLQVLVGADVRVHLANESLGKFDLVPTTTSGFPGFVSLSSAGYDVRDVTEDVFDLQFQLTTQTTLRVTHGGGAHRCLAPIGVGTFAVEMVGGRAACALVDPTMTVDTDVSPELDRALPAANYTVTLTANSPAEIFDEGVLSFFVSENDVVPEEAQVGLTRTVTYQQDIIGEVTFAFRATPTVRIDSASPLDRPDCFAVESNDAVMIVEPNVELTLALRLFELYHSADVGDTSTCHNVSGTVVVQESVTADGSGAGNYPIDVQTASHTAVRASVDVELLTGLPELLPPHEKRVRVAYGQMRPATEQDWLNTNVKQGRGRVKGTVIIVGSLEFDFGRSFAIPEYVPFLILRDPPGGDSTASFAAGNSAGLAFSVTRETHGSGSLEAALGPLVDTEAGFCIGLGAATCKDIADAEASLMGGLGFAWNQARSDSRALAYSVSTGHTITTSGEPGLAGSGGDVFVSASVAVQFIETARIFVPESGCAARRFDFETWILLGAEDTDAETPGHAENRLFAAQSGSKVDSDLGNIASSEDDNEAAKLDYNKIYDEAAVDARSNVREGLSTVFSDENAWNTHSIHTLHDILAIRIPVLEQRAERAEVILGCFNTFDEEVCPPVDVLGLPSQSASIQAKRKEISELGIEGWKETLRYYKKLNTAALEYPMKARQLFSSSLTGNAEIKNQLSRDAEKLKKETDAANPSGSGWALHEKLPLTGRTEIGESVIDRKEGGETALEAAGRDVVTGVIFGVGALGAGAGTMASGVGGVVAAGALAGGVALQLASGASFSTDGDRFKTNHEGREDALDNDNNKHRLSFTGGGHAYEYEAEVGVSSSQGNENSRELEFKFTVGAEFGIAFVGFGLQAELGFESSIGGSDTGSVEEEGESSQSHSFSLADSHLGDVFEIELYTDPVYQTTVFRTVAGQSRCPWEVGTAPRTLFTFELADGLKKLTLFSKGADTVNFPLVLKNLSPTGEDLEVFLYIPPSTNTFDADSEQGGDLWFLTNGGIDGLNNGFTTPPIGVGTYTKTFWAERPVLAKNTKAIYRDIDIVAYQNCDWDNGYPGNGQFNSPDVFDTAIDTWASQRSDQTDTVTITVNFEEDVFQEDGVRREAKASAAHDARSAAAGSSYTPFAVVAMVQVGATLTLAAIFLAARRRARENQVALHGTIEALTAQVATLANAKAAEVDPGSSEAAVPARTAL